MSIIFYHDVTIVAITNAQYKGSNTVAGTRTCEQVNSCIIPIENKIKKKRHFLTDILIIQKCKYIFFFYFPPPLVSANFYLLSMKQSSWTLSLYLSKEEIRHTLKTVILTVRSQNSKLAIKVTVPLLKASSLTGAYHNEKHRLKRYHRSSTSNLHFSAEKSHNHPNSLKERQAGILGKGGQGEKNQSHKQMDITSHFMNLSSLEVSIKKST